MKIIYWSFFILIGALTTSCAILKEPEIIKRGEISNYKFVVLPNSENLNSRSGAVFGNQYGVYGGSTSKEINPSSTIEGILLKRGLISTDTITSDNEDKTLIVKYGESGRRDVAGGLGGYTLEVTIAFVSAKTKEIIYSCVAEGQGSTEVDDIREAIHRCLSGI